MPVCLLCWNTSLTPSVWDYPLSYYPWPRGSLKLKISLVYRQQSLQQKRFPSKSSDEPACPHPLLTSQKKENSLPPHWHFGSAHWSVKTPAAASEAVPAGPFSFPPGGHSGNLLLRLTGKMENRLRQATIDRLLARNARRQPRQQAFLCSSDT